MTKSKMKKLLKLIEAWLKSWIEQQNDAADAARAADEAPSAPAPSSSPAAPVVAPASSPTLTSSAPLGLASCWDQKAQRRMMNILSPRMSDKRAEEYVAWMKQRGCTAAHVILANGADGEAAGYAAWRDSDRPKMLDRMSLLRAAGLVPIPWIITDDSSSYLRELFKSPESLVRKCADFLAGAPYAVLGLEMDEGGSSAEWSSLRKAVRQVFSGPLGVHHTSGNSFKFAPLGEIILGQLDYGCTEADVKKQISAIRAKGKRAIGFEYSGSPANKLAKAALAAGAEGVGNW